MAEILCEGGRNGALLENAILPPNWGSKFADAIHTDLTLALPGTCNGVCSSRWHDLCSYSYPRTGQMTSIRPNGRVEFRFFCPDALRVKILGTFNHWTGDSLVMTNAGDGWWTVDAKLDAGEHRFRYLADEQWFTDYAAFGIEACKYGWNSVLIVPPERVALSSNTPPSNKPRSNKKARFVHDTTAKLAA